VLNFKYANTVKSYSPRTFQSHEFTYDKLNTVSEYDTLNIASREGTVTMVMCPRIFQSLRFILENS